MLRRSYGASTVLCNRHKKTAYLISKTSSKIQWGEIVQFFFIVQTKPRGFSRVLFVKCFDKSFLFFSNGQVMEQLGSRDMLTSVITSTGNQNVRDD